MLLARRGFSRLSEHLPHGVTGEKKPDNHEPVVPWIELPTNCNHESVRRNDQIHEHNQRAYRARQRPSIGIASQLHALFNRRKPATGRPTSAKRNRRDSKGNREAQRGQGEIDESCRNHLARPKGVPNHQTCRNRQRQENSYRKANDTSRIHPQLQALIRRK